MRFRQPENFATLRQFSNYRHSRAGGNPILFYNNINGWRIRLDSRLRGNDGGSVVLINFRLPEKPFHQKY